jgi:hypothetical protein
MFGWIRCRLGLHDWWPVNTKGLPDMRWHLENIPSHVCMRCPAKRYGNRV